MNTDRCKMKLTRTKPNWLFIMIVTAYITSLEASDNEDLRVLIVGFRGHTRFRAANILLGRTDSSQEERETVRSEVITDEGRRMMVVTGPNLCERDTERQALKRALILSSPGPHAILMTLNLQDEEDEECDYTKQIQELLGTEVLQYCVVVLYQNDPEKNNITRALRGKVGEMINTCRERFHIITDSHPKPAQTSALIREIDKLVWINEGRFYSSLNENTEQIKTDKYEEASEDLISSVTYSPLGWTVEIIGWILLISLTAAVIFTKGKIKHLNFGATSCALLMCMVTLRNILSPDVAIPINLALCTALTTSQAKDKTIMKSLMPSTSDFQMKEKIVAILSFSFFILPKALILCLMFTVGLGLIFGSFISVRSWSDMFIACHAAFGVSLGIFSWYLLQVIKPDSQEGVVYVLGSLLSSILGASLSMGCVTVFNMFGVRITIFLLILMCPMAYFHSDIFKSEAVLSIFMFIVVLLLFSCGCVLTGSVILFLPFILSLLKVCIGVLLVFYVSYSTRELREPRNIG